MLILSVLAVICSHLLIEYGMPSTPGALHDRHSPLECAKKKLQPVRPAPVGTPSQMPTIDIDTNV